MLYALLMLGLLPAAFLVDHRSPSDDDDDAFSTDGATGEVDDPAAEENGETVGDDARDEEDAEPADFEVPAGTGQWEIACFRPGLDRLTMHSDSADATVSSKEGNGDPTLRIDGDRDQCMVSFRGLDTIPLADISIVVTDRITGEVSTFRLQDVDFGPDDWGDAVDEAGIDPNVPDKGDSLAGGDETGLDPADPATPDSVAPGDPWDAQPLDPTDPERGDVLAAPNPHIGRAVEDVTREVAARRDVASDQVLGPSLGPHASDEADGLDEGDDPRESSEPGSGDWIAFSQSPGVDPADTQADALAPGDPHDPDGAPNRENVAGGGEAATTPGEPDIQDQQGMATPADALTSKAEYSFDAAGTAALIDGFVPGADVLTVVAYVSGGTGALDSDVHPSSDGQDGEVWIGGVLCAVLRAAPHASVADLHVTAACA
jgi:hypothetical protein